MKLLSAFFKTALFFALLHLVILVILVLITKNISYLNIFYILGLTEFFPEVDKGLISFSISTIITIAVFLFFYLRIQKKNSR